VITDEYPVLDAWESIPAGWNRTSPRTNSDEAFEVTRAWIEDCLSDSHKFCESPQSPPLPTRIVDVGLLDDVVKLIESEGGTGKYFCLVTAGVRSRSLRLLEPTYKPISAKSA
jgi:hypothetical protein